MDNSTDKGDKADKSPDELDLTGLQNFNFAANWSEAPTAPSRKERDSAPRGGPRRERHPDRRPQDRGKKPRSEGDAPGKPDGSRPRHHEKPRRREERPEVDLLRNSPFDIQIFPEEPILATLTRAMRHSLRTYELFEIARLVLEKPDRFHVSLRFHEGADSEKALFQSVPDGLPFLSEEGAVDHVVRSHLDKFFTIEEVEAEPPKGDFHFIARCTLTGDFLSPPNYHRYQPILLQYYQERFSDMPFERFRSHIETVKDEEAIARWLESMKKQSRYTIRGASEGEEKTFDSPDEARAHLLQNKKDKVVRSVKSVRFPGDKIREIADPAVKPYVQAYIEHQKRFPLETANNLRGRLRRQHFFIYKKGSRGISLVCAVKRKFRQPNQVFSETIQALIAFLEQHDQILASHLPEEFLGIAATGEGEESAARDPAEEEKLKRLNIDLRWLLSEGYVTEYSDGRLSVHPILAPGKGEQEASKKTEEQGPSAGEQEPTAIASPKAAADSQPETPTEAASEAVGEEVKPTEQSSGPEDDAGESAENHKTASEAAPKNREEEKLGEEMSAGSENRQPDS